ncbi:YdhR family protein [Aurantiacibacter gilvus]|uniref:YdhR family protein n=1 Tax=Aurantiacibacter gilvus TaxID=3139141 RepID=A0ABU9IG97_9SPHN
MHTVIVKYPLAEPRSREQMLAAFKAAEGQFASLPGLVRKYFAYDETAHCGHSVYLFTDKASAQAFFGPQFAETMQEKFGAEPEVFGVDTLLVIDGPEA